MNMFDFLNKNKNVENPLGYSTQAKRSKKLLGFNASKSTDESYKHLRTFLLNSEKHDGCPVFAIVAPNEKTGCSLVASNLAVSFAQLGKKVLLIDANMRNPKISKNFGLLHGVGLSDLLSVEGDSIFELTGAVVPSGIGALDVLIAGNVPPNPAELLASKSFEDLLAKAKTVYEYVLIYLPPVCDVADACVIKESVTGYIFTVRSAKTDSRSAKAAIGKLESNGGKIIGTVLTDVNSFFAKFLNK